MAGFIFENGSQTQATAFTADDNLVFNALAPSDIVVTFTAAGGLSGDIVNLSGGGQSLNFNAGEIADASVNGNLVFLSGGAELFVGANTTNDTIDADGASADAVFGLGGDDTGALSGAGAHIAHGGAGEDTFTIAAAEAGDYSIFGEGDDDTVDNSGGTGNINIFGGLGADSLEGGDGNDHIYGNVSAPTGTVADGDDSIDAGAGSDYINGNAGADDLDGGADSDRIFGGMGDDTIVGGTGDGNDSVNGNKGDDDISGGAGDDSLRGGADDDTVSGGDDDDIVQGDLGDDSLSGDAGIDLLTGGDGADTFAFADGDAGLPGSSGLVDTITDFTAGTDFIVIAGHDAPADGELLLQADDTSFATLDAAQTYAQQLLTLSANTDDLAAIQVGADTYVFYDAGGGATIDAAIKLVGVTAADLTVDDFTA